LSEVEKFPHLGKIEVAERTVSKALDEKQVRRTILFLAGSVALMMTGFGIILPVFARRLGELGAGVGALGLMTMTFALAQLVAAPFLGVIADRYGRRPPILLALAAFTLVNIGFLFARSIPAFVVVRTLEGALTAGLFPAAMGVVADTVPAAQRARWVGIVMGGYGAGFFLGPVIGGFLYDNWGYAAPFIASAVIAAFAFIAALMLVPETLTQKIRKREKLANLHRAQLEPKNARSLKASLPHPLSVFGMLLFMDFIIVFGFAFVEPQMIFFFYDDLDWTTIQFGIVVAVYGLTTVIGQVAFGQASDKMGRKPISLLGTSLTAMLYVGLAIIAWQPGLARAFFLILLVSVISGLGEALALPALSAYYLDITPNQHRARIMGIKEGAAALGGVVGPLLIVATSDLFGAMGVFILAAILTLATVLIATFVLIEPKQTTIAISPDDKDIAMRRALLATSTINGVVATAIASRTSKRISSS